MVVSPLSQFTVGKILLELTEGLNMFSSEIVILFVASSPNCSVS
jgi:hypothetical protein